MTGEERELLEARLREEVGRGALSVAATETLRGYGPQILGYLSAILRDDEAGREVVARVRLALWEAIGLFRGDSSFKTWASQIAFYCARESQREPVRRRER